LGQKVNELGHFLGAILGVDFGAIWGGSYGTHGNV